MILIYTAIFGGIADKLRAVPSIDGIRFVAFVSPNVLPAPGWEVQIVSLPQDADHRRRARQYKLQPDWAIESVNESCEFSVWMDGAFSPKFSTREELDPLLAAVSDTSPLATFRHSSRSCVWQEARECIVLRKDRASVLQRQVDAYFSMGYPYFNGLWETGVVVRKHCPLQYLLDSHWWNQLEQFSCRDQIGLPFVSWLTKIPVSPLPGTCYDNPFFNFYSHW